MRDMGLIEFGEPMMRLFNQGIILGPDGKSHEQVARQRRQPGRSTSQQYGADVIRALPDVHRTVGRRRPVEPAGDRGHCRGSWPACGAWSTETAGGARSTPKTVASPYGRATWSTGSHRTITARDRRLSKASSFNTADRGADGIHQLPPARQEARSLAESPLWGEAMRTLVLLLAPICPHIAEEFWVEHLRQPYSVHQQAWPVFDRGKAVRGPDHARASGQRAGAGPGRSCRPGSPREKRAIWRSRTPGYASSSEDKPVANIIVVPGKLVNVVVH